MTTSDRVRSSSGSSSTVSSSSKRARAHASAVNTWLGARRATGSGSTAQRLGRERRSSPARGSWCPPGAPVGGRLSRGKRSPPQQRAWVAHRGDEAGEVCACEWPFRPGPAQAKECVGTADQGRAPGAFMKGAAQGGVLAGASARPSRGGAHEDRNGARGARSPRGRCRCWTNTSNEVAHGHRPAESPRRDRSNRLLRGCAEGRR